MDAEAYRLNTLWTATRVLDGGSVGPEASANKIHWSETDLAIHRAALALLGTDAELLGGGPEAAWLDGYLFALAGPIYAGTNEIQRNVVAERMLGLPRGLSSGTAVHFAFTDQQLEFRDAVRQVLAKVCTTDDLRAAYDAPAARTSRWAALAELGVVGLPVPEDRGGLGLGLVDLVLLLEEAGRVALPEPLVETSALTAPLLVGAGFGGAGRRRPSVGAPGWRQSPRAASPPPSPRRRSPRCRCPARTAPTSSSWWRPATTGAPRSMWWERTRVAVTPVPSLDPTRRLGPGGLVAGIDTRAASGEVAAASIRRTADRAAVASAAQLLGLTDRMITMAADYARERHQFGKPIGSFQAVKHLLAGAQVALEFARPVVYAAAWALDEGEADRRGRRRRPRPTPRRRPPRRPGSPSRCTGPSATRGSATCTCSSNGRGPCPRRGAPPPTTVTACWPHSSTRADDRRWAAGLLAGGTAGLRDFQGGGNRSRRCPRAEETQGMAKA